MSTESKSPMAVYTEQLEKLKGDDPTTYAARVALQNSQRALDCAVATQTMLLVVLLGLISTGAADGDAVRKYLASLIADLSPEQRQDDYGHALTTLLNGLGTGPGLATRGDPPPVAN